jgi:hypothetical protein
MRFKLAVSLVLVAAMIMTAFTTLTVTQPAKAVPTDFPGPKWPIDGYPPSSSDNVILKWDEQLLNTIRLNPATTGPTITARAIGVLHTATYDAWAAYDANAVGTRLGGSLRRPQGEFTDTNKSKAISYAAYRVLVDLFPDSRYPGRPAVFAAKMTELGYDPNDTSEDTTTPQGIGNRVARAVLEFRHHDGANQLGDEPGGTPGVPYSDTTGYQSVNTWNTVNDRWRWQPLCIPTPPPGATSCAGTVQKPLTPHWKNIASFALTSPYQFDPPGPPKLADGSYDPKDIDTALADTSNLTDTKKMMAEYWADGPKSEFPPGHWAVIAQALSRKQGHSIDTDAKMFFTLGNALLDASISAWAAKYKFDFVRPITAIRERYTGKLITSWLGPYKGYAKVPGQQWIPYQAPNVVTPPFPEYTSGHSTFSGAGRVAIVAFIGGDTFNARVTIKAGSSLFEPRDATHVGTPAKDVVLSWKNLLDASDQAGWSRRYGGIHFYTGDVHGRANGASIGYWVWETAKTYFNGTAPPPTA